MRDEKAIPRTKRFTKYSSNMKKNEKGAFDCHGVIKNNRKALHANCLTNQQDNKVL